MIAKIVAQRSGKGNAFGRMLQYLSQDEKLAWVMASDALRSLRTAASEMRVTAAKNPRVTDPTCHIVLSWSPEDAPTAMQMQMAARRALDELGLGDHQWVAVSHRDGLHSHAHIVVNRIHPTTFRTANLPWSALRLQHLAATLDDAFGWRSPSAETLESLKIGGQTYARRELLPARLSPRATARQWQGRPSFQEWLGTAIRLRALEVISRPDATWQDLHSLLGEYGVRYEQVARGGVLVDVEDERFRGRASHMARFASLPKLVARLGPYEPPKDDIRIDVARSYRRTVAMAPPARGPAELRLRYAMECADITASAGGSPTHRWRIQRSSERERRRAIKAMASARLKIVRTTVDPGLRQAARAAVLLQRQADVDALIEQIASERAALKRTLAGYPKPPSWRAWLVNEAKAGDLAALEHLASLRRRPRLELLLGLAPATPNIDASSLDAIAT